MCKILSNKNKQTLISILEYIIKARFPVILFGVFTGALVSNYLFGYVESPFLFIIIGLIGLTLGEYIQYRYPKIKFNHH